MSGSRQHRHADNVVPLFAARERPPLRLVEAPIRLALPPLSYGRILTVAAACFALAGGIWVLA